MENRLPREKDLWQAGILTVNTTMCSVSTTPLLLGFIDLNVRDYKGVYVQTLHLNSREKSNKEGIKLNFIEVTYF